MCVCILHINCIILYFLKLFCSLDRNGNIKTLGFYTLQVKGNIVILLNYDLLELEIQDNYKKPYYDYVSFRFLRLCFRIL